MTQIQNSEENYIIAKLSCFGHLELSFLFRVSDLVLNSFDIALFQKLFAL